MIDNKNIRILLVDDEPIIAITVQQMLSKMGYLNIEAAYTEEEAISILENSNFDLAILDINLGNGDEGIDLAKICLKHHIPFFFLTSYSDKTTLDKAFETSPGAYIFKPFLEKDLYSAIALTMSKVAVTEQPIVFKDKRSFVKLFQADILYLKADNLYIEIHTKTKTYVLRGSIKKFLEDYPSDQLVKVNRTYAVNINHIRKIDSISVTVGEIEITISRTFKDELMKEFNK